MTTNQDNLCGHSGSPRMYAPSQPGSLHGIEEQAKRDNSPGSDRGHRPYLALSSHGLAYASHSRSIADQAFQKCQLNAATRLVAPNADTEKAHP